MNPIIQKALKLCPVVFDASNGQKLRLLHSIQGDEWFAEDPESGELQYDETDYEAEALMEKLWREKLEEKYPGFRSGRRPEAATEAERYSVWPGFGFPAWHARTLLEALAAAIVAVYGEAK